MTDPISLESRMDRLRAVIVELWKAEDIDLHMCDGTTAKNKFGLLRDIRDDGMALLAALSGPIDPKAEVEPVGWETPSDRARVLYLARKLWNEDQFSCAWSEENREHYIIRAAMQIALSASPSIVAPVGVPEGWQLVPKEPTQEMLDAVTAADQQEPFSDETMRGIFIDMLAAAPALTPAEKAGVGDGEAEAALKSIIATVNDKTLSLKSVRIRVWAFAKNALDGVAS